MPRCPGLREVVCLSDGGVKVKGIIFTLVGAAYCPLVALVTEMVGVGKTVLSCATAIAKNIKINVQFSSQTDRWYFQNGSKRD